MHVRVKVQEQTKNPCLCMTCVVGGPSPTTPSDIEAIVRLLPLRKCVLHKEVYPLL